MRNLAVSTLVILVLVITGCGTQTTSVSSPPSTSQSTVKTVVTTQPTDSLVASKSKGLFDASTYSINGTQIITQDDTIKPNQEEVQRDLIVINSLGYDIVYRALMVKTSDSQNLYAFDCHSGGGADGGSYGVVFFEGKNLLKPYLPDEKVADTSSFCGFCMFPAGNKGNNAQGNSDGQSANDIIDITYLRSENESMRGTSGIPLTVRYRMNQGRLEASANSPN